MKKYLVLMLLLCFPVAAFATNGYFLHGIGTASKAMAGASVALPQEALDTETNPALGVFVPRGRSFSLALCGSVCERRRAARRLLEFPADRASREDCRASDELEG